MYTLPVSEANRRIFCYYVNPTHQIQIARITNIPNWYFEKVVFPEQRLMFEAWTEAILEIQTQRKNNFILSKHILCNLLRVPEDMGFASTQDSQEEQYPLMVN